MRNLVNSEIISILSETCKHCENTSCAVRRLAQNPSHKSLSTRLNMERANQNDGIIGTMEKCTILDPKNSGDLTL